MSGVNANQSMSDFAKLIEKRNDFIHISLAIDCAVKLYHRYMLSLVSQTKEGSKSISKRPSAKGRDWGTARKAPSNLRKWDLSWKANSSTKSAPRWAPSSRNNRNRNRFGSSDGSNGKSEEMEYLAMILKAWCQIDIDISNPFHTQVQILRLVGAVYSFEDGTRERRVQEWEGYKCDTEMAE